MLTMEDKEEELLGNTIRLKGEPEMVENCKAESLLKTR